MQLLTNKKSGLKHVWPRSNRVLTFARTCPGEVKRASYAGEKVETDDQGNTYYHRTGGVAIHTKTLVVVTPEEVQNRNTPSSIMGISEQHATN